MNEWFIKTSGMLAFVHINDRLCPKCQCCFVLVFFHCSPDERTNMLFSTQGFHPRHCLQDLKNGSYPSRRLFGCNPRLLPQYVLK